MNIRRLMNSVFIGISLVFLAAAAQTSSLSKIPAPLRQNYKVGGSVSGLIASGLVLQNSDKESLVIDAHADSFQFSTPVASGGDYNVTIIKQPPGLRCTVGNGAGTNVKDDIQNIILSCYKYLYIANKETETEFEEGDASVCYVNTSGYLGECSVDNDSSIYAPQDMVINAAGNLAYVLNSDPLTDTYSVTVCQVNSDGSLGACNSPTTLSAYGSGLTLTQGYLYITDTSEFSVSYCSLNANGSLNTCSYTGSDFSAPAGRIGITPDGTCAVVANFNNSTVTLCTINPDGTLTLCAQSGATSGTVSTPGGVFVSGGYVYIANTSNTNLTNRPTNTCDNTVAVCEISDCALSNCTTPTTPTFSFGNTIPVNLFVSNYGFAYIPEEGINGLSICTVDNSSGALDSCTTVYPGVAGTTSAWVSFAGPEIPVPTFSNNLKR